MRLVIWANQANATQFAQIAPLVIEHVKRTPLAVTLIRQAAGEIDRLGSALAAQSLKKNPQPAGRAGAVCRTMAGGLSAVAAGALRVRFGQRRASDDPQSSPRSAIGGDWQQIERTMSDEQSIPNFR